MISKTVYSLIKDLEPSKDKIYSMICEGIFLKSIADSFQNHAETWIDENPEHKNAMAMKTLLQHKKINSIWQWDTILFVKTTWDWILLAIKT